MTPISLIEFRLSRDCSLADFPGYEPFRAREEYSLGVPIAERFVVSLVLLERFNGLLGLSGLGGKFLHLLEPTTLIRVVIVRLLPAATVL